MQIKSILVAKKPNRSNFAVATCVQYYFGGSSPRAYPHSCTYLPFGPLWFYYKTNSQTLLFGYFYDKKGLVWGFTQL